MTALALAFAAWSAAAPASDSSQKADTGFGVAGPVPIPLPNGTQFGELMADGAMRYQRIPAAWDQFGTWDGSRCVAPTQTGPKARVFINDVAHAEQAGQMPMIVIGPDIWGATNGYWWPAGAQLGTTPPSDHSYECGAQALLQMLVGQDLSRTAMPIEPFNEPDNSTYYVQAAQAASFFADLVMVGGSEMHPIAGAFKSPYDDSYASTYLSALKSSGYNSWATSWSVHDYYDLIASQSCSPGDSSACDHQGLSHFVAWLGRQGEPTNDVWVTEAGDASLGGAWLAHTRSEEADTAYAWEQLRSYAQHVFWYQWQTFWSQWGTLWSQWPPFSVDDWDSALLDSSGKPRPSYCVIAFGETPEDALADSRCPGS